MPIGGYAGKAAMAAPAGTEGTVIEALCGEGQFSVTLFLGLHCCNVWIHHNIMITCMSAACALIFQQGPQGTAWSAGQWQPTAVFRRRQRGGRPDCH